MSPALSSLVYLAALGLAVIGVIAVVRNAEPGRLAFLAAALLELLLIAQSVVAAVSLAQGHHVAEPATVIGYLFAVVVMVPASATWILAERTRWNGAVLAVAALASAVMTLRLHQMWSVTSG